jgi:Holliday junction resolvasome RuvABC endonuclease subunit
VRSAGIDLASAALSAISLAVDGEPAQTAVWKPADKRDSDAARLEQFEFWLRGKLFAYQPDIVVVEETIANFQNPKAPLQIAKREGVALLVAKKRKGSIVISAAITRSRSIVLSRGNLKKEVAFDEFKKLYPKFKLLPKTTGGMDQCDAMVHALAGPVLLERR